MSEFEIAAYPFVKAIHLAGVVCWFAGLFYIVRLFIYHVEAEAKDEPEKSILINQFKIMERRLWYGITVPSAIITVILGLYLVHMLEVHKAPWFHMKGTFLIFLIIYHFMCGSIRKKLFNGIYKGSSKKLRIFNEIATLLLFAIIFTIVLKDAKLVLYGMIGLIVIGSILFMLFSKRLRAKS